MVRLFQKRNRTKTLNLNRPSRVSTDLKRAPKETKLLIMKGGVAPTMPTTKILVRSSYLLADWNMQRTRKKRETAIFTESGKDPFLLTH